MTTVFYPAAGTPGGADQPDAPAYDGRRFPLLVFAHGFGANGPPTAACSAGSPWPASWWLPTFPLSNNAAPGGPRLRDYVNQPADVSFVIDEMLRLDADQASPYAGLLRRHRIAAAGHSLGGITTIGLLNDCCIDPRIDAFIPMSGVSPALSGRHFLLRPASPAAARPRRGPTPVPYAGSLHVFDEARRPKFLLHAAGRLARPVRPGPGAVHHHQRPALPRPLPQAPPRLAARAG